MNDELFDYKAMEEGMEMDKFTLALFFVISFSLAFWGIVIAILATAFYFIFYV